MGRITYRSRLPELIKAKRKAERRRITNREISEVAGISKQAISQYWMNPDAEIRSLDLHVATLLAGWLGVKWCEIVEPVRNGNGRRRQHLRHHP